MTSDYKQSCSALAYILKWMTGIAIFFMLSAFCLLVVIVGGW